MMLPSFFSSSSLLKASSMSLSLLSTLYKQLLQFPHLQIQLLFYPLAVSESVAVMVVGVVVLQIKKSIVTLIHKVEVFLLLSSLFFVLFKFFYFP
jgi:hypothetical protein